MAGILAKRNLPILAYFAWSNVLLAFDYDGTLAPIAPTPARARMRAETRRLLADVARRYPCVVISGRALDDLLRRLGRIPVWYAFGDHGLEPPSGSDGGAALVGNWVRQLNERLTGHSGIVIEEKKHSVTIHYRHVRDKRGVRNAIADVVSGLPDVRALGGVQAVSLIPRGGPDKGVALQQARRMFACQTAIYVGDDDTDEDAFASAPPGQLLSIRVGAAGASKARYRLRSQRNIDRLLRVLLALRAPSMTRLQDTK
jgi:trehalose 6-phosphate phosphatase